MNFNENDLRRDKTKLLNLRFSKLHSIVQRFYINWSLTLKTKSCWHCIPKMCRKEISSSNIAKAKKILFLNCVSNSVVELNICTAIKKNIQIIKNLGPHIYICITSIWESMNQIVTKLKYTISDWIEYAGTTSHRLRLF